MPPATPPTTAGANGVDATGEEGNRYQTTIAGNNFACESAGISIKGGSRAVIINNRVTGGVYGVVSRPPSEFMLQDNVIEQTEVGVYVSDGVAADLGGGNQGSLGDNRFDDNDWDLQSESRWPLSARNNQWSHSPCCAISSMAFLVR